MMIEITSQSGHPEIYNLKTEIADNDDRGCYEAIGFRWIKSKRRFSTSQTFLMFDTYKIVKEIAHD